VKATAPKEEVRWESGERGAGVCEEGCGGETVNRGWLEQLLTNGASAAMRGAFLFGGRRYDGFP